MVNNRPALLMYNDRSITLSYTEAYVIFSQRLLTWAENAAASTGDSGG